jgi:putative addiction module component (TIGR02574 family)
MESMSEDVSDLLKRVLALPVEARAALVGSLLDSLDDVVDEDAEAAWEKEISRRVAELRAGKVTTVPWQEVRRRLSAKLAERG